MELKKQLNHYDEREFSAFVQAIWNVEVDASHHDALIAHFDKVVGHPSGSDLLFYSELAFGFAENEIEEARRQLHTLHEQRGLYK